MAANVEPVLDRIAQELSRLDHAGPDARCTFVTILDRPESNSFGAYGGGDPVPRREWNASKRREPSAPTGLDLEVERLATLFGSAIADVDDPDLEQIRCPQERGHEARAGVIVQRLGRAELLDDTVIHDGHGRRHRQSLRLVMGDIHRGDPQLLLQPRQLDAQILAQSGVEIGERLIKKKHRRLHHQRARHREPLLLATGERRRFPLGKVRNLDHPQEFGHAPVYLGTRVELAPPPYGQRIRHVARDIHMWPDRVGLKHHAKPPLVWRNADTTR